jgi:AraC-like DNA-binding protein
VGERVIGDCVLAIEPGEIVLLGPNLPHVWRYDSTSMNQSIEAIAVHFREDFLGNDFLTKPEMRDLRLLLSRASLGLQVIGQTRAKLVPQVERLREQAGFERLLNLLGILNTIARSREVLTLCSPVFQPIQAELELGRLQRVFDYVKSNFDQPIDRDSAADLAHMSPSAFSRFFRSRTGVTFQSFVTDVRIGHACKMLLDPEIPITSVAVNCGFLELSTFNRAFRKLRNMSPGEYRTRMEALSRTE